MPSLISCHLHPDNLMFGLGPVEIERELMTGEQA